MKEIEQFQKASDQFFSFMEALPTEVTVNKVWGPKEVLAHLLFWQNNYLNLLHAEIGKEPAALLAGSYDELNQQVAAASRQQSVKELLRQFKETNRRLVELAQTVNLAETQLIHKKGASPRSLRWHLKAEANHIKNHLRQLQAQASWNGQETAKALREAAVSFAQLIANLPKDNKAQPNWGPREVLIHLVYWQERYVDNIEAILAERPFPVPRRSVNKLNQEAIADNELASKQELLDRFLTSAARLAHFSKTLDPQQVVLSRKVAHDFRTLDDILTAVIAHIQKHHKEVSLFRFGG